MSVHWQVLFETIFLLLCALPSNITAPANNTEYTYFISGGLRIPATQNYTRFMVSLRTRHPTRFFGDNHFCAGTIIGRSWVLTAAHCVMDKRKVQTRPRAITVVAGTPNRLKKLPTTILMAVDFIKAHPNFTLLNTNDIALIRLKDKIPLDNDLVQIMKLPSAAPPYDTKCVTLGWGRMYYNGPLAAAVTHVSITLYTDKLCQRLHPHYVHGVLCAGDQRNYDQDACRGDSGGPLICNDEVTGVVSYTIGCGSKIYPSLYTDVYDNLKWIQDVLKSTSHRAVASPVLIMSLLVVLYGFFVF